jgi:hypothetical protein
MGLCKNTRRAGTSPPIRGSVPHHCLTIVTNQSAFVGSCCNEGYTSIQAPTKPRRHPASHWLLRVLHGFSSDNAAHLPSSTRRCTRQRTGQNLSLIPGAPRTSCWIAKLTLDDKYPRSLPTILPFLLLLSFLLALASVV